MLVEEFEVNMSNCKIYDRLQTINSKPSRVLIYIFCFIVLVSNR